MQGGHATIGSYALQNFLCNYALKNSRKAKEECYCCTAVGSLQLRGDAKDIFFIGFAFGLLLPSLNSFIYIVNWKRTKKLKCYVKLFSDIQILQVLQLRDLEYLVPSYT